MGLQAGMMACLALAAAGSEAAAVTPSPAAAAAVPFVFAGRGSAAAVSELITRVVSADVAKLFDLTVDEQLCGRVVTKTPPATRGGLCFRVSAAADGHTVKVEGSSAVELARGVGSFLREYANMSFSWERTGGHQTRWAPLPSSSDEWAKAAMPAPRVEMRRTNISYYQNVVASSYTHAFWKFEDWEHFCDWLALSGINVALAYTGQEEVYRKAFAAFGVNDTQFGNWSNGPAWHGWSRGQSMHGVGVRAPVHRSLTYNFLIRVWGAFQKY